MIELRSFRRVFELERRIYRVDRLRLNPGGVPLRGVVYFLALVAISVLASAIPLVALLARAIPWYVRALVLPALGAGLLALIRVEGRPFHVAARALLGYGTSPRLLAGLERRTSAGTRWIPEAILLLPDGSDAHMRKLRYVGPGSTLITVAHERSPGRGSWCARTRRAGQPRHALTLRERPGGSQLRQGQVVVLDAGARLLTLAPDAGPTPTSGAAGG